MNFKQFQNIYSGQDWRSTWFTRQDWIKKEGSEYFSWIVPVTIAGAQSSIEIGQQFPRARKYLPLDFIEVMNNDVVNLTLIINNNEFLPVPAASIRPMAGNKLWQISVRNDDAAAPSTLNSIIVTLRRQPQTIDDWARRQP
ncbi:MAG: hypothetical protein A2Z29_04745 [Chloroflexi bacterium RBG_16_56_11]|nr:MAG: hypothetical protein A2Z29_04745 [Chloroflexi bacterium RBG_16_56_11]